MGDWPTTSGSGSKGRFATGEARGLHLDSRGPALVGAHGERPFLASAPPNRARRGGKGRAGEMRGVREVWPVGRLCRQTSCFHLRWGRCAASYRSRCRPQNFPARGWAGGRSEEAGGCSPREWGWDLGDQPVGAGSVHVFGVYWARASDRSSSRLNSPIAPQPITPGGTAGRNCSYNS